MKFGIMCSPHWPEGRSQASVYEDTLGHMLEAERLGYWSAWTTEHHFAADPDYRPFGLEESFPAYDVVPDPLTLLSHVAARTSRIRLGTGVLVVHYDDPIRIAERAAMVDLMSGGRLELGLGRGGGVREPAAFKVPSDPTENQDKYFEAIDVMRKAWSGESFEHQGAYFNYPKLAVVPTPLQKPIPVYLSNRNPRSIAYAAQHGMSYASVTSAWGGAGIDSHNAFHETFRNIALEHGHGIDHLDFPQTLFCYIAPSDSEAIEMAERSMLRRDAYAEAHYESRRRNGGVLSPLSVPSHSGRPPNFADQFKMQLETNLIGSPATVAEKLAALKARLPTMNYALALIGAGAAPVEFDRRSMALLASEVAPKFADK